MQPSFKQQIRHQMREARRDWLNSAAEQKSHWDSRIAASLAQTLKESCGFDSSAQGQPLVALYRAKSDEVDPAEVRVLLPHWQWCYPRVQGSKLQFYRPQSEESFTQGAFSIFEPDPNQSELVDLNQCAACVVPAVGFDRWGGRLGQGRGFYDRALEHYRGFKVGLAYSVQISEKRFQRASHDVAMDVVITEKFIVRSSSTERIEEG